MMERSGCAVELPPPAAAVWSVEQVKRTARRREEEGIGVGPLAGDEHDPGSPIVVMRAVGRHVARRARRAAAGRSRCTPCRSVRQVEELLVEATTRVGAMRRISRSGAAESCIPRSLPPEAESARRHNCPG